MKNEKRSIRGSSKLYNPSKEGIGCYDVHYINAYKRKVGKSNIQQINADLSKRYAA